MGSSGFHVGAERGARKSGSEGRTIGTDRRPRREAGSAAMSQTVAGRVLLLLGLVSRASRRVALVRVGHVPAGQVCDSGVVRTSEEPRRSKPGAEEERHRNEYRHRAN